jgi:HEAT repeat protein
MVTDHSTDFQRYLESVCTDYEHWLRLYTITQVVDRQPASVSTSERTSQRSAQEKPKRLPVLLGLRKYAANHVLLMDEPGAGKTTALERLLLEEAQRARKNPLVKVPVLVELRQYQTSVLDLVQAFLQRHDPYLDLDEATLKSWLRQGRLLLLVDGINELPSQKARRDLKTFRVNNHRTTPMIFTTRNLGAGCDLGISKQLEMQPLTEAQLQQFVYTHLPKKGDDLLGQLSDGRLKALCQKTPLLLRMLCEVFGEKGQVPRNLGLVFRQFAQVYESKFKEDVTLSDEDCHHWLPTLLQQLAFRMMQGDTATEMRLQIEKQKAETDLSKFLQGKVPYPDTCARRWLEDLLNHHLISLGTSNEIEFQHQLLQEYYAAERLLEQLPNLSDAHLKREYLNYLKWTEPLALVLALVDNKDDAVRVVKLALEVDLMLGARLAGEVKLEFQAQTVGLVAELEIPQFLKLQFLSATNSESAVPALCQALQHEDVDIRHNACFALGDIGSEEAIPALCQIILQDNSEDVRLSAVFALERIDSNIVISTLCQVLQNKDSDFRCWAVQALRDIDSEAAIPILRLALTDEDWDVCESAFEALENIGSKAAIATLRLALVEYKDWYVRMRAAHALGEIGGEGAITALRQALADENWNVRKSAIEALGKICGEAIIAPLRYALEHEDYDTYQSVVASLGQIHPKQRIPALHRALADENRDVDRSAAPSSEKVDGETTIPALLQALSDQNLKVRASAAAALRTIGDPELLPCLCKLLLTTASNQTDEVLDVITAIQERCGYYNYTLATSPPPQEESIISELLADTRTIYIEKVEKIDCGSASIGAVNIDSTIHGNQIGTQHNK